MLGKTNLRLFLVCPNCNEGEWLASHIGDGGSFGPWFCQNCGKYCRGRRVGSSFELEPALDITREKITVTLQSKTNPPITLKLNSWQFAGGVEGGRQLTAEECWDHTKYYYNTHTCPTNYMNEVAEIIFEGDSDPHGVFEFVSIDFGHIGDDES